MTFWLSIEVRLLHGRYHGRGDWPPTPLRLFQAVVAGALSGRWAVEDRAGTEVALRWWEALGPPTLVLAPPGARRLKPYRLAVPNNQADRHLAAVKKGALLDKLLAGDKELKHVTPRYVGRDPLTYAWELPDAERESAKALQPVVRRLTALGHGIDHAIADAAVTEMRPDRSGSVSYPAGASSCTGTLDTLISRYYANLARLAGGGLNEALPPIRSTAATRPRPANVSLLFTLRQSDGDGFAPIDPLLTALLAHAVRSYLADRLCEAVDVASRRAAARAIETRATFSIEDVDRFVVGRSAAPEDAGRRPLFLPLPSVGHEHADGLVRRLLIAVPAGCPVAPQIVRNALSDHQVSVGGAGTVRLEAAEPDAVVKAYLPKRPTKVWETVSPVLVSGKGARSRRSAGDDEAAVAETARLERRRQERIADLVGRALAYSGLDSAGAIFELRREPWSVRQPRADAAWRTPQNDAGVNWLAGRLGLHIRLALEEPVIGPLTLGDGRYLGLGLMVSVK